jgi:hypothetical protein
MFKFLLAFLLLSAFAVSQPISLEVWPCDDFQTPLVGTSMDNGQETWFGDSGHNGGGVGWFEEFIFWDGLFVHTWGGREDQYGDSKWIFIPFANDIHYETLLWMLSSGLHQQVSIIIQDNRIISYAGMMW